MDLQNFIQIFLLILYSKLCLLDNFFIYLYILLRMLSHPFSFMYISWAFVAFVSNIYRGFTHVLPISVNEFVILYVVADVACVWCLPSRGIRVELILKIGRGYCYQFRPFWCWISFVYPIKMIQYYNFM